MQRVEKYKKLIEELNDKVVVLFFKVVKVLENLIFIKEEVLELE